MKQLVIDIETIPCQAPDSKAEIGDLILPPGNITKPESIEKWLSENREEKTEELYRKTSFDGSKGEICCIGWAVENGPVFSLYRDLHQSEADMLTEFFDMLQDGEYEIIGHNVISFDIRFLYQRCVISGVKPSFNLWQNERYTGGKVFDTMTAWAGWGNRISLVNLCAALNIPVKSSDITGATVWDAVLAGRIKEVSEYCKEDVSATRSAYRKMTFEVC